MSDAGKKLNELRVCDLKDELEKRKLETIGAKATLVERLEKALKDEGLDPAKHLFTPAKVSQAKKLQEIKKMDTDDGIKVKEEPEEEVIEGEEENGEDENGNEQNKNGEDFDDENGNDETEVDQVGTVDDECIVIEEESEVVEVENNENDEENNAESNNQDNEESINLTIGEDEQEFLHNEGPEDKDKTAELNENQKDKPAAKDAKSEKANVNKDEKRNSKEEDATKIKKKDDKSNADKKDDSEQKPSAKSSQKDDKEKSNATNNAANTSTKSESGSKTATPTRNLWVSGLSALTRASDLKTIFSKYGKVIGAKVVTNTRTPGTRCYGYVTMSSSADASRCIDHLHRTELHGRIISVERTKNEIGGSSTANAIKEASKRKDEGKSGTGKDNSKASDDKRKSDGGKKDDHKRDEKGRSQSKRDDKRADNKEDIRERKDKDSSKARSEASSVRRVRDHDRERIQRQRERERERERIRQREILSYQKIRQERERQRQREREREQREEERRRREIRERQRQEEQRLADERKKLALERERLEREKAELLRLERERQKLEREKIELERLELKRQQMKIIQARDDPIKRVSKRPSNDRYPEVSDRKRPSGTESRFEAPPPPRFDASLVPPRSSYDKKRDDYSTSSSKRGLDDYSSSSKRIEYSKRDDYTSSGSKRSAIDDYVSVPPKRTTDDYTKRSSDYISSSKRGIDDYSSTSKRDTTRDDYKREVEIRHIPTAVGGTTGSFHSNRDVGGPSMHKTGSNRYGDSDRSSGGNYRRGGLDDMRNSSNANKRYDGTSGGYSGNSASNSGVWAASSNHLGHSGGGSGGAPQLKSYVSNGISSNMHSSSNWQKTPQVDDASWRPMQSNQDRYDRTYNERSSGYPSGGGMYANNTRPVQDRYGGGVSSRY